MQPAQTESDPGGTDSYTLADHARCLALAKTATNNYLDSIQRAYLGPGQGAPAAFLLITCLIDFLGSLHAGKASGEAFECFVKRFMRAKYTSLRLYDDLRCPLAHEYRTARQAFVLVQGRPCLHLKRHKSGCTFVNLDDFFSDVRQAAESYFAAVESSRKLTYRLTRSVSKRGTMGDIELCALKMGPNGEVATTSGSAAVF
jgi:hypothetical protein